MKKWIFAFLLLLHSLYSYASNIYGRGLDGQKIFVEGYVHDEPKFHSNYGGKYQSYSFRVNAASSHHNGDEFISVSFYAVKWGKKVGEFNFKKGDKVRLEGVYHEFKNNQRGSGIVGSLSVNDLSLKEVEGR
ncbi:MAG: hypothetical protein ACXVLQ_00375 [Bacteriovorax sp.]